MQIDLFKIQALFAQIGVPGSAFNPVFDPIAGIKTGSRNEQGAYGAPYYANGANGREYYMPVTITYPVDSLTAANDGGVIPQAGGLAVSTLQELILPYPVISIKSRKTIVETPLTERRGTVKELINIGDYEISIRGFMINTFANEYPEQDVITLRQLYEQNVPLGIKSVLTDIFLVRPDRKGSDQVIIKSLDFPEMVGVKGVRHYVMELCGDAPFNLIDIS